MIVPLIDREMYDRLAALRTRMVAENIGDPAHVFVPVGTDPTTALTGLRVLFVGKATRDWGDPDRDVSFESWTARATKLMTDYLTKNRPSSFWQFIHAILGKAVEGCGIQASGNDLPSFCGWSNLAKIGDKEGNPHHNSVERQKELCVAALRAEIAFFRPTAIVVASSEFADAQMLYSVFGKVTDGGWRFDTPERTRVAYKAHQQLGATVIWTNHPQGMSPPGTRAIVQDCAVDLIVRTFKGQELPAGHP